MGLVFLSGGHTRQHGLVAVCARLHNMGFMASMELHCAPESTHLNCAPESTHLNQVALSGQWGLSMLAVCSVPQNQHVLITDCCWCHQDFWHVQRAQCPSIHMCSCGSTCCGRNTCYTWIAQADCKGHGMPWEHAHGRHHSICMAEAPHDCGDWIWG